MSKVINQSPGLMVGRRVFDRPDLLASPVRRAAYSDRTAWLMAAMSELAYFKFEATADDDQKALAAALSVAGFELINVYHAADTQAFLAKKQSEGAGSGMRVLAFRGTEKSDQDLKTNLNAPLTAPDAPIGDEKIHTGFYKAFQDVRPVIEQDLLHDPHLPLYVTGHSLGGALAITATRFIAADSLGACYTFGSPRVGNLDMGLVFKTPIYRVVNAADIVPRVPLAYIGVLVALLNWIPLLGWLTRFLERFQGYVHFGDMRYFNHVALGQDDGFEGLRLISNPSLPLRASWVVRRWIRTLGRAGVEDHAISLYRRKLKALDRN